MGSGGMIADRVRHARMYHGWSQGELAKRVGTTQPKISQLEHGTYMSSELVDAIAEATQYSRGWFERGPLPDMPTGSLRFRKQASSRGRDDERVIAHVRQAIEVIEEFSGLPQAPPVRLQPVPREAIQDPAEIEDVAQSVRRDLGVGISDPIPHLVRAVERAGVAVIGSVVDIEKHGGASYWPDYPLGRPIICVSRGMSGDRQRFTVAHEVGHLVLHQFRNLEPRRAEPEAHRFAGALLIPKDAALESIAAPVTLRTLAQVKSRWGISIAALIKRCLDLHIIGDTQRLSLEKQLSARGWRREEPVEVRYEEPALVRRLIEIGTGDSIGKSRKRFGLPAIATRDLVA